jgi:hypothetical protein
MHPYSVGTANSIIKKPRMSLSLPACRLLGERLIDSRRLWPVRRRRIRGVGRALRNRAAVPNMSQVVCWSERELWRGARDAFTGRIRLTGLPLNAGVALKKTTCDSSLMMYHNLKLVSLSLDMIFLADISYGIAVKRELPAIVAPTVNAAVPTLTRVAVAPIEERDSSKAVSGKPTNTRGGRDEGSRCPLASAEAANEGPSGCGWRLTYESELNRVFLDLVERDTNVLVMRIPRESLIKFLRSACDFAPARTLGGTEAQCDMLA